MKYYTFIFFNACFNAMLTIALYDLTFPPISDFLESNVLKTLRDYYRNRSIMMVAIYSFTLYSFVILTTMIFTYAIMGFLSPYNSTQVIAFSCCAFVVSFVFSLLGKGVSTEKDLEDYYEQSTIHISAGVRAMLGCIYSYMAQKYLLPMLL